MESEMGDVRPLISEQVCSLTQQEIDQVVKETINYFSPAVLNGDIDSLDDSFADRLQSDVVLKIWNNKLQSIKNSLKPVFDKSVKEVAYATFNGKRFDLNSYMYDMLNRIIQPLMSEYDNSWVLKSTASAFVGSDNFLVAKKNAHDVFADMIDAFFTQFKMTITRVPFHVIMLAKKLKKCKEISANPRPFNNTPHVEDFKKSNNWILSAVDDRLKQAV
jgi:hypothetical protein